MALQTCKNQLRERQDRIEALEARQAKDKAAQKREERLLMSAVYELGMDIINTRLVSSVGEGLRPGTGAMAVGASGGGGSGTSGPGGGSWLRQKREEVSRKINPVAT